MNIIAADVGGTKTRLVFAGGDKLPKILHEARYLSGEFDDFESLLTTFIEDSGLTNEQVDVLMLALPGPVTEAAVQLTNLPWMIEKQLLKDRFGIDNVYFMNDFQASAFGTRELQENDKIVLNRGVVAKSATSVVVGAGTGLGLAWLQINESSASAYSTEGGHIDFAPVDDTQIRLLQFLQLRYDHVSYERLLSGDGLVALYEFCAGKECQGISAEWVNDQSPNDEAASDALSLFVQIYGAYVGNIALLFKPYGGVFITGGIAAKMLEKMQSEIFIDAYLNKGRMRLLVEQIPVYLVTNERVGALGAMSEAVKMQQELQ